MITVGNKRCVSMRDRNLRSSGSESTADTAASLEEYSLWPGCAAQPEPSGPVRGRRTAAGKGLPSFLVLVLGLVLLAGCAATPPRLDVYHDPAMDFSAIRRVAILPFVNLAQDPRGAERVRDVFANALLATEAFYVLPSGEVFRGINRAGIVNRAAPSPEEVVRFAGIVKADAVITGVVREYGTVRSGSISANTISMSLSMVETQTGTVVWSATSTKGGISTWNRLFGGGGKPMNEVTRDAVEELLDSLFM